MAINVWRRMVVIGSNGVDEKMDNTRNHSARRVSLLLGCALLTSPAYAIDVYLDFSGADPLLHGSWIDGGYSDGGGFGWTASDFLVIQHSVKAKMDALFAPFTISFSDFGAVPPGPHTSISFSATGGDPGLLGLAPGGIDWRNKVKTDPALVYSGKFGGTLMGGATTPGEKAADLDRFANALTNIAAHELGHTLGLQHCDCYGHHDVKAPGYGDVTGQQTGSIMSSGPSGATIMGLGDGLKSFSPLSIAKLEYADDVTAAPGLTIAEVGGNKDTLASAQAVNATMLAMSGITAVNIDGEIGEADELDLYKFEALEGSLLTLNSFSALTETSSTNTVIALLDSTGTVLTANDNISFAGNSFMTGAGFYSSDSLILNFEAAYTGTYYAAISGPSSGNYEYLITGAVPEPGTMIALGLGMGALAARRRKKA